MDIELAQALAENELLKSLLYCTKRSCNNCGKVNCENFQRQRKDCCGNWVSYKDYIKKLEAQIEKMRDCGNCKNEGDYKEPYRYGTGWCNICKRHKVAKGNFDKWEIKEK
jgi:hypothetical protein